MEKLGCVLMKMGSFSKGIRFSSSTIVSERATRIGCVNNFNEEVNIVRGKG